MIHNSNRNFVISTEGSESSASAALLELSSAKNIKTISSLIRALDSPLRIEIILALNERPHYVHELVKLVKSSQPLVSQHLKVLKSAGIVDAERQGRQMTYSLAQPLVLDILLLALNAGVDTPE
ncbi:transcriptional regulator [Corynebacterium suranareeae]|uniref:Transcriptional regulator n=1 Tax=Corynebacterium suranareeae TaxID=2506452 RepID=A0A160PSG8_9CORY|nr:metalloregulator ArsR/SmtB family transcription factor [Corynebacterium suranareeae]BAU96605.1 transcriptional regulator [Corynebacterium suranareeae]